MRRLLRWLGYVAPPCLILLLVVALGGAVMYVAVSAFWGDPDGGPPAAAEAGLP